MMAAMVIGAEFLISQTALHAVSQILPIAFQQYSESIRNHLFHRGLLMTLTVSVTTRLGLEVKRSGWLIPQD